MARNLKTLLLRSLIGVLIFFVLCFVVGVAAGYMSAHTEAQGGSVDAGRLLFWFAVVVATACMAGGIVISVYWMRSIDEAAREAHKAAWFWGGASAMAMLGVPVILAMLPQSADWALPAVWFGRTDPAAWMAAGSFGSLIVMTLGYSVVWAWWWLARR